MEDRKRRDRIHGETTDPMQPDRIAAVFQPFRFLSATSRRKLSKSTRTGHIYLKY
jgi:hypothetical protein